MVPNVIRIGNMHSKIPYNAPHALQMSSPDSLVLVCIGPGTSVDWRLSAIHYSVHPIKSQDRSHQTVRGDENKFSASPHFHANSFKYLIAERNHQASLIDLRKRHIYRLILLR